MLILTLRTDKPEAELGLYDDQQQLGYEQWQAHRQLAETIHGKLQTLLKDQDKTVSDLEAIVCFQGPGSFTGLRIGLTVANALGYSEHILVLAAQGEDWLQAGIRRALAGENDSQVLPFYGADAHITAQKK